MNSPEGIDELEKELEDYFDLVEGNIDIHNEVIKARSGEVFENTMEGKVTEYQWATYKQYLLNLKESMEKYRNLKTDKPSLRSVYLKIITDKAKAEANAD